MKPAPLAFRRRRCGAGYDRGQHGAALVELAVSLPLFLLCLLGIMYFGRFFYTKQALFSAAQQGAMTCARIANLNDATVLDQIRGFTTGGTAVANASSTSPIYQVMAAANLLTSSGDLPAGATVSILPWDNPSPSANYSMVTVTISYPFSLLYIPTATPVDPTSQSIDLNLGGSSNPNNQIPLSGLTITESTSVTSQMVQSAPP